MMFTLSAWMVINITGINLTALKQKEREMFYERSYGNSGFQGKKLFD
jgi:hypothetical protein